MLGPPLGAGQRVLVHLPSWVGDLVMAEPAVRAVYEHLAAWGGAGDVTLAAPGPLLELLEGLFPEARRLPEATRGGAPERAWRGHDVALLFRGSFRSAWTAWRAGIPRRVGWSRDGRAALLTDRIAPPLERGRAPRHVGRPGSGRRILPRPFSTSCRELVALLGIETRETRPRLALGPLDRELARARLTELGLVPGEGFVLINAGARPGSAKAYPPASWAAAIELLGSGCGLPMVLVCGPGEEVALKELCVALGDTRVHAVLDPPAGLRELAALSSLARLVLTADSGPRHVARAVGARLVCVAGPTDPRHTAEHAGPETLLRHPVACGPCHRERCPLPGDAEHACMRGVAPERVAAAALEHLA